MLKLIKNDLNGISFAAAILMKIQNIPSKEAIHLIRKLRPYSIETDTQEECILDYEKSLLTQTSKETS